LEFVGGRSMQPSLNPNESSWRDMVVSNCILKYNVKRGDIVSLRSPIDPSTNLVKRVIALEGDTVQTLVPYYKETVVIPKGKIWVEGDERFHSEDSNHFGPVPLGLVRSKIAFVIWPPSRIGLIKDRTEHIKWRENRVQKVSNM